MWDTEKHVTWVATVSMTSSDDVISLFGIGFPSGFAKIVTIQLWFRLERMIRDKGTTFMRYHYMTSNHISGQLVQIIAIHLVN